MIKDLTRNNQVGTILSKQASKQASKKGGLLFSSTLSRKGARYLTFALGDLK